MSSQLTRHLARYAAETQFESLPPSVAERAKRVILDEVASAYFGKRSLAGDLAARYAAQFGGAAEARIHSDGRMVSAPYAALANGTAGHGEEVDGAHVVGGHPGATIVHAAVAMAERQRASGADLINAVVLGYDVGTRAVAACGKLFSVKDRFGLNSDFLYTLGATAAAARLLGLDSLRHCHAMALATFQSNGLFALFSEKRHISKSFYSGQYAFAGVSAALMAVAGLEGNEDIFGAPYGVLHAWGVEGGKDILLQGLGEHFTIMEANFKMLNAGYPTHAPVEAAMRLVAQHGIASAHIAGVEVGMPTQAMKVVDGRDMHNICVQDILTAALVRGGLHLRETPFPAVLSEPEFTRLRSKVVVQGSDELDRDQPHGRGAIVSITTLDGQKHALRVDHPRGHSQRGGLSWEELRTKWQQGLPECDVDKMIAVAQNLDQVDDVRELLETVQARSPLAA